MKYFGTFDSFDRAGGSGQIKPDLPRDNIRFETTAILWDKNIDPIKGQRLSYDIGSHDGQPRALNLQTI
jgi:cold shock CspA family protein